MNSVADAPVATNRRVLLTLAIALAAILGGLLLAFGGPLAGAALFLGIIAAALVMRDMELGLWGTVAVVCLLPFATIPIDLGLTPTFLDTALGAFVGVWLLRVITRRQKEIVIAPITIPLVLFILIAIFAFIFGMQNGPFTPTLARKFAELLLSIGLVIVVVDYCRSWTQLERVVTVVLWGGAAAAAVAIGLWLLPDDTANQILNLLSRVGYPAGWVIRYIEENPALAERAIGTSIDPNALGGLLTLFGALAVPQAVAAKPLLSRWTSMAICSLILLAILLTFSRGAFLALAAAVAFVAVLRYRKLIPYGLLLVAVLFVLPITQGYVFRLIQGLTFFNYSQTDLASQMRLGEFRDAWALIARYPIFGVGFAGSPDIDLYLGVANVYLSIAQQMGLIGLLGFVVVIATLFTNAYQQRRYFAQRPRYDALWLGLLGSVVSGLAAGLFDHYLFNTEFHHTVTAFWLMVGLAAAATRLAATESLSSQAAPQVTLPIVTSSRSPR